MNLSKSIDVKATCNLNQLHLYKIDEFDAIISTIDIENFIFQIPVINKFIYSQ